MLKLYYSENSSAYAPHMLLLDVEAKFQAIRVDLKNKAQLSADFLSINPKGRVPVLVTPEGILTETPALLLYISQINPERNFAPTDPFTLAQAQALNMYIASTVHVGHAHKHRGERWTDDPTAQTSMTAKVRRNMFSYAKFIEDNHLTGPWALGGQYSMCDPYLSLVSRWLRNDGLNLNHFPKLTAHENLMGQRPSHQTIQKIYK